MKVLSTKQIKEADEYTIKNEPVKSIDLMERAAKALAGWVTGIIPKETRIRIFAGPGNNGGDGLALGRLLTEKGFTTYIYLLKPGSGHSPDTSVNLERLKAIQLLPEIITSTEDFPLIDSADLLVDALFGTGLTRPVEGLPAKLIDHLNNSGAPILAVDIPSGLFGDDNRNNLSGSIIKAKYTLSFQFPKLSFLFPENNKYTGNWEVIPIGLHEEFIKKVETNNILIDNDLVSPLLKERNRFSHKGTYGHCLLISGSYGKMGAAVLAATSCLRTGTGLLTVHVPARGCEIIQISVPEAMVSLDNSDAFFSKMPDIEQYDAVAAGPALGTRETTRKALYTLIKSSKKPVVLDADALNILSLNREWIDLIPEESILTPHPGEFDRLAGQHKTSHDRLLTQIRMAEKYKLVIILKGAYTSIVTPEGKCFFNSSGNPGMATAGSGDVLTGILLSLLGQGYTPVNAAVAGVYLHGVAGDNASTVLSPEAMIAGDISMNLGKAFKVLKKS
ncbi:MAG: NAD(P)H-hydrate dehydratase [Bacteroidales bacterium]